METAPSQTVPYEKELRHSKQILEYYLPDKDHRVGHRICRWENRHDCNQHVPCDDLSWFGHVKYGGLPMSSWICLLGPKASKQPLYPAFQL